MSGSVSIQDAASLSNTLKVNADGSINVTAASGGDAVTIADGADVTQGAKGDAVYAGGAGSASVVALLKGLYNATIFLYAHISTAATTTVKSGAGTLHTITVNGLGTVASICTIYDNTAGSGTVIGILNTLAGQQTYDYDVAFTTGLTLVTTGTVAPDITVSYR